MKDKLRFKVKFAFLPVQLDNGKWIWLKKYNSLETYSLCLEPHYGYFYIYDWMPWHQWEI